MLKKVIATLVSIVVSVVFLVCGTVSAVYIPPSNPQYNYTQTCSSELEFSGGNMSCRSEANGYKNKTTKITFIQTLQKRNSSNIWSDVSNASWTTTVYNYTGSVTNTKSSLSSGTYRLKTVFKVYAGTSYETITVYSLSSTI